MLHIRAVQFTQQLAQCIAYLKLLYKHVKFSKCLIKDKGIHILEVLIGSGR